MSDASLDRLYPKWNCPKCGDWFHMPHKFCKCNGELKMAQPKTLTPDDLPLLEIKIISDGGPWAMHNYPCTVCGNQKAVRVVGEGYFLPCWSCQKKGWKLTYNPPFWRKYLERIYGK